MMLTACSKWNVEIVDPTEKPSESLADLISGESDINKEDEETIPVYPITEDMLSIDATGLLRYKILYYDPFENAEPDFSSEEVFWVNKYPSQRAISSNLSSKVRALSFLPLRQNM
jgi:hypothetical protein